MRAVHVSSINKKNKRNTAEPARPRREGIREKQAAPWRGSGERHKTDSEKTAGVGGGRVVVVREVSEAGDAGVGGHTLTA